MYLSTLVTISQSLGIREISCTISIMSIIRKCVSIKQIILKIKKKINFDITHHELRADTLQDSYKNYQTVKTKDFEKYPAVEKEKTVSGIIRNIDRKDMYIEKSILKKHFFK